MDKEFATIYHLVLIKKKCLTKVEFINGQSFASSDVVVEENLFFKKSQGFWLVPKWKKKCKNYRK